MGDNTLFRLLQAIIGIVILQVRRSPLRKHNPLAADDDIEEDKYGGSKQQTRPMRRLTFLVETRSAISSCARTARFVAGARSQIPTSATPA